MCVLVKSTHQGYAAFASHGAITRRRAGCRLACFRTNAVPVHHSHYHESTIMKTLLLVFHPSIDTSVANKRWLQEVAQHPERYTVHDVHQAYPDGNIDVAREQALVEAHGNVVLQFPVYWFNCPPLLKKWLDEVLAYGWAYGAGGDAFRGRKVALAVTAGIREEDFTAQGKWNVTLAQLLAPFDVTLNYIGAEHRQFFAFYGAEDGPSEQGYAERLGRSAQDYVRFLSAM
jgi:putative NADPH-quinone reductase